MRTTTANNWRKGEFTAMEDRFNLKLHENQTHGWCSLWRATTSVSPVLNRRDIQDTFTGSGESYAVYTFDLPVRKAGAKYTVQAQMAGAGGTNSFGKVSWSMQSPDEKP